jgi:ABC-type nitrate/sulfonate/bicarbonate transport system substrate-binding protein
MGLMHTALGKYKGLDLAFNGFPYGGPLNQAAIGGEVDVVLTADQPALVLLDRSDDFAIVGRMMHNRACLYAPAGGGIAATSDLVGKRVAGPVGAAAERVALEAMTRAGIDLGSVTFGSLDMAQQSSLLLAAGKGAVAWPGIDALYGFDPLSAAFAADGYAKVLECGRIVSVVMMRKSTVLQDPQTAADFMCAFTNSWRQYTADKALMNDLFLKESGLTVSTAALDDSASLESNFNATSAKDFRFDFNAEDMAIFDGANKYLVERGIIKAPVDVAARIDLAPLHAALASESCTRAAADVPYAASN